ncbi:ATP-binding protein [Pontibacter pamirensis]|uniref:ATP-binding protein n=1 Tax=Pontibacter pamirensis TaxID=2562824 RepID=UPI0013895954|nr:ATP-binding protein [Pontibacter pamirensis]
MRKQLLIVLLMTVCGFASAQDIASAIHLNKLPAEGILLEKGWKFHAGDKPEWANPEFDDSQWQDINPTLELPYLPQMIKASVGWLRIELRVDSSLLHKPLAFQVYQSVASEIYLNGELLKRYGTVSANSKKVNAYQPMYEPVGLAFKEPNQVLAVRFSVEQDIPYLRTVFPYTAFRMRINDVEGAGQFNRTAPLLPVMNAVYTGIFLILSFIHLGLFFVFRKQKANLYFSVATLSVGVSNGFFLDIMNAHDIAYRAYALIFDWILLLTLFNLFLFIAIHHLFSGKRDVYFWVIVGYSLASVALWWVFYEAGEFLAFMLPFAISMLAALRIAWLGYRRGQRDAGIIVAGTSVYLIFYSVFTLFYQGYISDVDIGISGFSLASVVYHTANLSVPITLSFYLAKDFAFTSKELEDKLDQVQQLSIEKQQILISQKETLEQQVTQRTAQLKQSLVELQSTQAQLVQREKMASLGELTAGIAHEIQNPLNFVNNFSEINNELIDELTENIGNGQAAEAKTVAIDVRENNKKINYHGRRADAIVKGMLQHARTSTGEKELTDINALVDEYLRLTYQGIRAKDNTFNVHLHTDFDNSIGKISIVPQDIERVLVNVFNNAFYSLQQKKKQLKGTYEPAVSILSKRFNDKIEIHVKDNGTGIPQEAIDKIFQPFFTTKPTGEGTGLGLSLSYDIIKAQGGQLRVETKEVEGATFIIQLPLV